MRTASQRMTISRNLRLRYRLHAAITPYGLEEASDALANRSQHTSGNKKAEEDANEDAESQMKGIKEAGKNGQDKVIADLLKAVFDVKPVVPDRIEVPS